MAKIKQIAAREILDSRGNPTIEYTVTLTDKSGGSASIPSGASTGKYEAFELRSNAPGRYQGKDVLNAVKNIQSHIATELSGLDPSDTAYLDECLVRPDGTANKAKLGAAVNAGYIKAGAPCHSERVCKYNRLLQIWQEIGPGACYAYNRNTI